MIMLLAAVVALILVIIDFIKPSDLVRPAVAVLAVGHILSYFG